MTTTTTTAAIHRNVAVFINMIIFAHVLPRRKKTCTTDNDTTMTTMIMRMTITKRR